MGHSGQSDLLYYAHAASHSRKTVVGTCGQGPLLNHRRLVLHQPNPAACGFWYLDAAAAFLRISGKLSKTKQKQNKTKQTNKPSNKTKKKKKKQKKKVATATGARSRSRRCSSILLFVPWAACCSPASSFFCHIRHEEHPFLLTRYSWVLTAPCSGPPARLQISGCWFWLMPATTTSADDFS